MRFIDPALQNALREWRQNPVAKQRSMADNAWFEERVGAARQRAFEDVAFGAADAESLRRRHIDYWETWVKGTEDTPHTFVATLEPTDLGTQLLDEFQVIIRVEALFRPLEKWKHSFEELQAAVDRRDFPVLQGFLGIWNDSNIRDHRPSFAAWKDEVLSELAADDWPDRLRDRLGLAHYDAAYGPIPVALMEYTVREVKAEAAGMDLSSAFTAPTVLDSGPWPHFFPAPPQLPYGRAMSLVPIDDEKRLLAEMLHVRLTYRPEHIARLGQIGRPPAAHDLKELRNRHLLAVQVASGRDDFGEEIP